MTPQQEARLLRARAKTLHHQADAEGDPDSDVGLGGLRCRHPMRAEADALDAVADELEAVAVVAGARSGDGQDHSRAYDAAYWTEQRCRFSGNGHAGCFAAPLNRHGGPCVPCWARARRRMQEQKAEIAKQGGKP